MSTARKSLSIKNIPNAAKELIIEPNLPKNNQKKTKNQEPKNH